MEDETSELSRKVPIVALGLLVIALAACFPAESTPSAQAADGGRRETGEERQEVMTLIQFDYTIQAGDTLTNITRNFGTTIERVMKDNNLRDKDRITAGEGLKIKFPAYLSEFIFTNKYDSQTLERIKDALQQRYRDLEAEGVYYNPGELDSNLEKQFGIAHVYGLNLQEEGLLTFKSSGRRFNPNELTAASWFYPLGTKLRLNVNHNQLGQKSVEVEVTDRGPNRKLLKDKDVIIDVTPAVAKVLSVPGVDLTKTGAFRVNVKHVSTPLPPNLSLPTQRPESLP